MWAEAIRDVAPHGEDQASQLPLMCGDVVRIIERDESGWWAGHRDGETITGWFPAGAVRILSGPASNVTASSAPGVSASDKRRATGTGTNNTSSSASITHHYGGARVDIVRDKENCAPATVKVNIKASGAECQTVAHEHETFSWATVSPNSTLNNSAVTCVAHAFNDADVHMDSAAGGVAWRPPQGPGSAARAGRTAVAPNGRPSFPRGVPDRICASSIQVRPGVGARSGSASGMSPGTASLKPRRPLATARCGGGGGPRGKSASPLPSREITRKPGATSPSPVWGGRRVATPFGGSARKSSKDVEIDHIRAPSHDAPRALRSLHTSPLRQSASRRPSSPQCQRPATITEDIEAQIEARVEARLGARLEARLEARGLLKQDLGEELRCARQERRLVRERSVRLEEDIHNLRAEQQRFLKLGLPERQLGIVARQHQQLEESLRRLREDWAAEAGRRREELCALAEETSDNGVRLRALEEAAPLTVWGESAAFALGGSDKFYPNGGTPTPAMGSQPSAAGVSPLSQSPTMTEVMATVARPFAEVSVWSVSSCSSPTGAAQGSARGAPSPLLSAASASSVKSIPSVASQAAAESSVSKVRDLVAEFERRSGLTRIP